MTLNGVMAVIFRYFSEFGQLPGALRKSSRSLSHFLMSSCKLGCHFGKRYNDLSPSCGTKEIIIVIIIIIRTTETWISICRPTVECTTLHTTNVPSSGNAYRQGFASNVNSSQQKCNVLAVFLRLTIVFGPCYALSVYRLMFRKKRF